jgi:Tctex-1 family
MSEYSAEEVERAISESIESMIGKETYQDEMAQVWVNEISKNILEALVSKQKPYKYLIDVLISQRNGSGMNSACASIFDMQTDGMVQYLWPKDKSQDTPNRSMNCLVTVCSMQV